MDKLLDKANKAISAGRPVELEVRLGHINISPTTKSNPSLYDASISTLRELSSTDGVKGDPVVEKSLSIVFIDAITKRPAVLRRLYPDGATTMMHKIHSKSDTYHGIFSPNRDSPCSYKLSYSEEYPASSMTPPDDSSLARLRIRTSRAIIIDGHEWSLDVTLVREEKYGALKNNRELTRSFFNQDASPRAVIDLLSNIHFEVEVELTRRGPGQLITIETVNRVLELACRVAYPRGVDATVAQNPRELLLRAVARIITSGTEGRKTFRGRPEDLTLKKMLNNAISLTKSTYIRDVYPMEGYYVTDKTDGERGIVVIDTKDSVAVITDTTMYGSCRADDIDTIYDGEVLVRAERDPAEAAAAESSSMAATAAAAAAESQAVHDCIQFYAFDCLQSAKDCPMFNAPFESRQAAIESFEFDIPNDNGCRIEIIVKEFKNISTATLQSTIESIYNNSIKSEATSRNSTDAESTSSLRNSNEVEGISSLRKYPIDGLIFTQNDRGYYETQNYKWKPYEHTTIDFLCFRCPESLYGNGQFVLPRETISLSASAKGRSDFRIYILFCGCSLQQRAEFCIQPLSFSNAMLPPEIRDDVIQFACRYEPFAYVLTLREKDLEPFGGDINGRVIEMRWRGRKSGASLDQGFEHWRHWDLIRARDDRRIGNNISVATSVFANYVNPFPLEALWLPVGGYFAKDTEKTFLASNKYRRFILTVILYNHIHGMRSPRILDLGGGRAQDFIRYAICGASLVVNFDSDSMAIAESAMRIEKQTRNRKSIIDSTAAQWLRKLGEHPMGQRATEQLRWATSHVASTHGQCIAPEYISRVIDVTSLTRDSFCTALKVIGLSPGIFDAVISSFAFHYFCKSIADVEHIFELMSDALTKTGVIIITTMDGEHVFDELKKHGGVITLSEPDTSIPKYKIRALYDTAVETTIRDFGQMIQVSVPFSDELYDEPLCNFTAIRKIAEQVGFNVAESIDYGADSLFQLLQKADSKIARELTTIDRIYTGFFATYVFRRATGSTRARTPRRATESASKTPAEASSIPMRRGVTRVSRVKKK